MVDFVREGDSGDLRDLTPEPEALFPKAFYKILGEGDEPVVDTAFLDSPKYRRVLRGIKVFLEIKYQRVALPPVLAIVFREEPRHPADGEIVSLALQTGPVVVDERPGEHRDKGVIA